MLSKIQKMHSMSFGIVNLQEAAPLYTDKITNFIYGQTSALLRGFG